MRFPPRAFSPQRSAGFTLLELLVVIAIIAVLAAILFPVAGSVLNRSRRVQAVADFRSINVAIVNYYTDYQKYPLNDVQISAAAASNDDTVYGDPAQPTYPSSDLFDILRAVADGNHNQNNELNPNQVVYWPGNFAKNPAAPREGITTQDVLVNGNTIPKGSLVDPWGHSYIIWIDANKDGDMTGCVDWFYGDVSVYQANLKPGSPPMGVLFASLGPDGQWGTKGNGTLVGSDDIGSWSHP